MTGTMEATMTWTAQQAWITTSTILQWVSSCRRLPIGGLPMGICQHDLQRHICAEECQPSVTAFAQLYCHEGVQAFQM